MKKSNTLFLLPLLLAVSCASVAPSSPVSSPSVAPPDWTTRTTYMEGPNLVFVLAGPADSAVAQLALPVMQGYLDLPVTADTPEVAASAIQKFLQKMSATEPVDRYLGKGKNWWKVEIPQEVWTSAREDLAALVANPKANPSITLERAADDLLKAGKYADALTGYLAAAVAAVPGDQPPLGDRLKSSLQKALGILTQLTLTSATPTLTTQVGQGFPGTFDVRLTYGSGAGAPVAAGVPLRFSYLTKKNGHLATTGQTISTDAQGSVKFELPAPDFSAHDAVVVLVDVSPWTGPLGSVPPDLRKLVSEVENLAAARKLQLPYVVESASKLVPMTAALADFDDKGSVMRRQESTSALIGSLQKAGFQVTGIQVNPTLLKSTNDGVILTAWKFQGKSTGRAVYGTVNLVSVTAAGSGFSAEVSGVVKVVDLATGKLVYQLKSSKVATAADKGSAVTQGFRGWGEDAAAELTDSLP